MYWQEEKQGHRVYNKIGIYGTLSKYELVLSECLVIFKLRIITSIASGHEVID